MQFTNYPLLWLAVLPFAVWRVTSIIHSEGIASGFRQRLGVVESNEDSYYWIYPDNFIGKVLSCFLCLSVWVSIVFAAIMVVYPIILVPFAASALAILINGWHENLSLDTETMTLHKIEMENWTEEDEDNI